MKHPHKLQRRKKKNNKVILSLKTNQLTSLSRHNSRMKHHHPLTMSSSLNIHTGNRRQFLSAKGKQKIFKPGKAMLTFNGVIILFYLRFSRSFLKGSALLAWLKCKINLMRRVSKGMWGWIGNFTVKCLVVCWKWVNTIKKWTIIFKKTGNLGYLTLS